MVIVAGADIHSSSRKYGLAVTRVRTEDGEEMPAADYFHSTGGCVTIHE